MKTLPLSSFGSQWANPLTLQPSLSLPDNCPFPKKEFLQLALSCRCRGLSQSSLSVSQNQHGSYTVSLLFNFFLYFPFFFSFNQLFILNCLMQNESESRSVVSDSLKPHGLLIPWNSPGQNTGVGTLSLLQGIFPTQGLNLGLPHCRRILYQLSHKGSLFNAISFANGILSFCAPVF